MDMTFLGPCLFTKIKELAGSSYKTPRAVPSQGKPCRVDSYTRGCDQTDLFPGSWATNPHSVHPHSSWLSLMITNGSINLPPAAWESHWDRCDQSSPQKCSERRISELGQEDEQHHFSPACRNNTSESLKPPQVCLHQSQGRAGQGFFGKSEPVTFCIALENIQLPKRLSFGSTLKSSSLENIQMWLSESCLIPLAGTCPVHPQGKEIAWWQLGTPKGREYSSKSVPGDWNQPLPPASQLSKPSLSARFERKPHCLCHSLLPCACQAQFCFSSALSLVPENRAPAAIPSRGRNPGVQPRSTAAISQVMGSSSGRSELR